MTFFNHPNHNMDAWPIGEMRARLIFIFRALKVDTVILYDSNSLYERNPDHYVTARAVESACWMARSEWDYPEHFKVGLKAHGSPGKVLPLPRAAAREPGREHWALYGPESGGQPNPRAGGRNGREAAAEPGGEGQESAGARLNAFRGV